MTGLTINGLNDIAQTIWLFVLTVLVLRREPK
jgi:hypothetical protein